MYQAISILEVAKKEVQQLFVLVFERKNFQESFMFSLKHFILSFMHQLDSDCVFSSSMLGSIAP